MIFHDLVTSDAYLLLRCRTPDACSIIVTICNEQSSLSRRALQKQLGKSLPMRRKVVPIASLLTLSRCTCTALIDGNDCIATTAVHQVLFSCKVRQNVYIRPTVSESVRLFSGFVCLLARCCRHAIMFNVFLSYQLPLRAFSL